MSNPKQALRPFHGAIAGFLAGTLYALAVAGLFSLAERSSTKLLEFVSLAMILGTPIAVGVVTVMLGTEEQAARRPYRVFFPWLSVLGWSVISIALAWETLICIVMLLPIYLPLASLGGAIGGYIRSHCCKTTARGAVSCFAALPFLVAPLELSVDTPTLRETVSASIRIQAPAAQVWNSLPNIDAIRREELPWTLSHFMGIPRPVSASTSTLQPGGIRDIRWEQGVHFQERITEVVAGRRLAYEVHADPQSMQVAELDTHIVVGDAYFGVESGRYELVDEGASTVLTLSTSYRMSTNLNGYGRLWARWVLDDFHRAVLELIRQRNESGHNPPLPVS